MPDYLIGLSIGPVQGFIAAARRTRDLWFGSEILSEISKAAARELHGKGCELIFPAPRDDGELSSGSTLNVGNKLLCKASTATPGALLEAAKQAAQAEWKNHAKVVKKELPADAVNEEIWNDQVGDVLELFGAWVRIEGGASGYKDARARLEQRLNARKITRDFQPAGTEFGGGRGFGVLKSSLDAARESVFSGAFGRSKDPKDIKRFRAARRKLGLSAGEHLDCPGLVKRLGGEGKSFAPITRIALEPWLEKIPVENLAEVQREYEILVKAGLATRVKATCFAKLPFDGALLFPSRIAAIRRDVDKQDEPETDAALNRLAEAVRRLHQQHGDPTPYFAVLVADGDRMGEFIDHRDTPEAHIEITQALSRFAAAAHGLVEEQGGACVYAGGDDVLAFLPVHTAVACARALRDAFAATVGGLASPEDTPPTLSVGLGLGHVLTPLPRLLDLGRRAERLAKDGPEGTPKPLQRNALAILVGVRSGAEIAVRGRWPDAMDERLKDWKAMYEADRLSDKTPYDLREALARVAWAKGRSPEEYRNIAAAEAERVLLKKRADSGARELSADDREAILAALRKAGLAEWVSELLVARWLALKAKE